MSNLADRLDKLYGGPLGAFASLEVAPELMEAIIRDLRRLEMAEEFIRDVKIRNRIWHNKRNQFLASRTVDEKEGE